MNVEEVMWACLRVVGDMFRAVEGEGLGTREGMREHGKRMRMDCQIIYASAAGSTVLERSTAVPWEFLPIPKEYSLQ